MRGVVCKDATLSVAERPDPEAHAKILIDPQSRARIAH